MRHTNEKFKSGSINTLNFERPELEKLWKKYGIGLNSKMFTDNGLRVIITKKLREQNITSVKELVYE